MTFLSPQRFLLVFVVAGLAAAYVVLQRRRRHYAVRFTNLELLESVAPRRPGWRRHVPAALIGLALVGFVAGLARPAREERVPKEEATVMLVVDTSVSMEATDVEPNRLEAAKAAARRFVDGLPDRLRVGLVAFDRTARVLATPTADHPAVGRAVDGLVTGQGTAAGDAVYAALAALAVDASGADSEAGSDARKGAAIVLLSDGVTTIGRRVEDAAADAAANGVPVTTIAFGTDEGFVTVQGQTVAVPADPVTMRAVAEATGGSFFEAFTAEELQRVYDDIGSRVGYDVEQREIGMTFVALAGLLLVVALAASLVWTARIL